MVLKQTKMLLKSVRSQVIHYARKGYEIIRENPVIVITVLVALVLLLSLLALSTNLIRSLISTPGCIVLYIVFFVLFVRLMIRALVFPGSTVLWRKKLESTYRVGKFFSGRRGEFLQRQTYHSQQTQRQRGSQVVLTVCLCTYAVE